MTAINTMKSLPTILALLLLSSTVAAERPPVILTTHELPPYGSTQADGSFRGVAADVVACVFAKMKRPFVNKIVPWKRAQILVQKDKAAGFYAGSKNAHRETYARASAVIADQKWMWYFAKGSSWNPADADFKAKARVASFAGANMHKWLTDNGFNITANPKTHEQLLLMVARGRLDAALVNNYVGDATVGKLKLQDRLRTVVNRDKPLSVHFSKAFLARQPGFLEEFDGHVVGCR